MSASRVLPPVARLVRLLAVAVLTALALGASLAFPDARPASALPWEQGPGAEAALAAARLCTYCGDELLVVRTFTGELFYSLPTVHPYSNPPVARTGTWLRIPGAVNTPYAPAVTFFSGSTVYVVAVGPGGNGIYTQAYHSDTGQWEPSWLVPGSQGTHYVAGPGAANGLGFLWIFAPDAAHRVRYNAWSPAGNWWTFGTWTDAGFSTSRAVGVAATTFGVRVVARGDNRRIYHSELGWGQTPWTEIPGGGLTDQQPGVSQTFTAPDLNTVVVTGIDGRVAYQVVKDVDIWASGWRLTPAVMVTPFGPAMNGWGSDARLYATGADGGVYVHAVKLNYGNPYTMVPTSSTFTAWRLMTPTGNPPAPPTGGGGSGGGGGGGGGTTTAQTYHYCVAFATSLATTYQDHDVYTTSITIGYSQTVSWANATKPAGALVNVYYGTCHDLGFLP